MTETVLSIRPGKKTLEKLKWNANAFNLGNVLEYVSFKMLIFCLGPNMLTHHLSRYFHTHGYTAVDFLTSRHEDPAFCTPSNLCVCDDQGVNLGATMPRTFGAGSPGPLDVGSMAWIPIQQHRLSSINKRATQQLFRFWSK